MESWRDEVDDLVEGLYRSLGELPYDPTPHHLYTATDLYATGEHPFTGSIDQLIYRRARHANMQTVPPAEALAQRLHDHGITVALDAFRHGRSIVGVMGGHHLARGSEPFRRAVELGAAVTQAGYCVATGGGPGAMEAANLGAAASELSNTRRGELVDLLAVAPSFADDPDHFVGVGLAVAQEIPDPVQNLAVPTWFYGHEPSNAFATAIAKYFGNSEREDGLLAIATAGIVFVPGGPGTIQEIFQDAAQNAYETFGSPSPMVFLSPERQPDYWDVNGVRPTLEQVFTDHQRNQRPGWDKVSFVSTVPDAVAALG
ncbi:MAG: Rossmann fold nucleotide-binding protein [Acidimicrobiales bacterium]|nr:Rossmann fold nucleotide-binding protein [Acidimicrobiales bacterium]